MLETVENKQNNKTTKVIQLFPNGNDVEVQQESHLRIIKNAYSEDKHKGVFYLPVTQTLLRS